MREIDFGNGSRLYDALAASFAALEGVAGRRVIVLFTAGQDTDSDIEVETVLKYARTSDVMLYLIGVEGREFDGEDFVDTEPDIRLQRLAADTGGGYFPLDDSSDVGKAFTRVSQELHTQNALAFAPTAVDGRRHKLVVRLRNRHLAVHARPDYVAAARQ